VQLVHDHLRETLIDQLRQSLTKLAFFASRLGRYFDTVEVCSSSPHGPTIFSASCENALFLFLNAGRRVLIGGIADEFHILDRLRRDT
jgi:hypothetical protein